MTKRQAENYAHLSRACMDSLGIARDDFEKLLRIEKTLHRWGERECNGEVEVDDAGRAFAVLGGMRGMGGGRYATANRERGALKRLATIMAKYPKLAAYHQGDPRGCALYVYGKDAINKYGGKVSIDSCYSSIGVALCY